MSVSRFVFSRIAARPLLRPLRLSPSRRSISEPTYQPPQTPPSQPSPPAAKPNPHRDFYYTFGSPVLKVFLGALFTYELLFYGWLKLENIEVTKELNEEVRSLEEKLATLTQKKSGA